MLFRTGNPSSRRTFLLNVGRGSLLASAMPGTAWAAATARGVQGGPWDMSWTEQLKAAHRAVFELPSISDGMGLSQAHMYMDGYRAAHGESGADTQVVIVMRSAAVPMAFNDVIWEKYGIAQQVKTRGPKNPFLTGGMSLASLRDRGAVLLACNMATMGQAEMIANRVGADVETVKTEVRANLAPGVLLMPNGVFAVLRAQDAGCRYFKST